MKQFMKSNYNNLDDMQFVKDIREEALKEYKEEVSLCKDGCGCMTKTINKCGKCGAVK